MTSPKDGTIFGDLSPDLVPVIETEAFAVALPQPAEAGNEIALGDLLSDALFGEVIDISDILPRVLSPPADASSLQPVEGATETGFGGQEAGDITAASGHGVLTILYDDDILASDGAVL